MLPTKSIWPVRSVVPASRAITRIARFLPPTRENSASRSLAVPELKVFAGLLVRTSLGPATTVCVIVVCRPRLLDILHGHPLRTLITLSPRVTGQSYLPTRPQGIPESISGRKTPLPSEKPLSRRKLRNIKLRRLC